MSDLFFRCAVSVCIALVCGLPMVARAQTEPALEEKISALSALLDRLETEADARRGVYLSDGEIQTIIDESLRWLLRTQEESGHFRYEYVPYENRYLDGDNIVRQAGSFYQLGEVLRHEAGDGAAIADAMRSSLGYFASLTREGVFEGTSFRCVAEHETSTRCKLGATAHVLVGLLNLAEYDKHNADADFIAGYAAFIGAMQKESGGFRNVFDTAKRVQSAGESSFSNGEALLALARYYGYRPDTAVRERAVRAFAYLSTLSFDNSLYLWMMAALADMRDWEPRPEYAAYAKAYTDWRFASAAHMHGTRNNLCAYTEGIVLAYKALDAVLTEAERVRHRAEISYWLANGSVLQITDDDTHRVVISDGVSSFLTLRDPERARGGFLTSESALTERIDFTQHCLNAYLVWHNRMQ